MSEDRAFLQQLRRELDRQVEGQSPSLQGRLRAARREALQAEGRTVSRRLWLPAFAASLFVVVTVAALWFQSIEHASPDAVVLLQAANTLDTKMLNEGDDLELYQELEFYYWLQQESDLAG